MRFPEPQTQARPAAATGAAYDLTQAVLDTIDVGIVACDAAGNLTMLNDAARAFHGLPTDPDAASRDGGTPYELLDEDGRSPLEPQELPLARALRGEIVIGEVVTIAAPGEPARVVSCDGRRLWHASGGLAGAVVAMTDITRSRRIARDLEQERTHALTEQVEAARRLQQAYGELTDALDALPRWIVLATVVRDGQGHAADLTVQWVNTCIRQRVGEERATTMPGRTLTECFPAASRTFLPEFLAVAETGSTFHARARSFAGDVDQGRYDLTVVRWGSDGLLIEITEVTAQQRAEASLRASEHQLRAAQELAGLAGWEWDLRTDELRWSPLMFAMLGVDEGLRPTPRLMIGLVHADDRASFLEQADEVARSATNASFAFRVVRTDGSVAHLRSVVTVERDRDGRPTRVWGANQDLTTDVVHEAQLAKAAFRDPLTGLLNRRGWDGEAAAVRDRGGAQLAIAMLDLDHFKLLNDTAGHAAGDAVLKSCAESWRRRLRSSDLLARMGGEEFAVLLPGCPGPAAMSLLDDLRALVPGPTTASAGLTYVAEGESVAAALARADAALYEAKRSGRNRTVQV